MNTSYNFENSNVGFALPRAAVIDRDNLIVKLCTGKVVLHLGCVDYPLLDDRLRTNQLLHQKILKVAKRVWGVDLDKEGIQLLSEVHKIPDLLVADVEELTSLKSLLGNIDVVVAGEILEHVNNGGKVLAGINELLPRKGMLIVSVPNALALRIFFHTLRHRENIHPDHVAYYSPYTLTNFLGRFGFKTRELYTYWCPSTRPLVSSVKEFLFWWMSKRWSFIGDGIVAIATKD